MQLTTSGQEGDSRDAISAGAAPGNLRDPTGKFTIKHNIDQTISGNLGIIQHGKLSSIQLQHDLERI